MPMFIYMLYTWVSLIECMNCTWCYILCVYTMQCHCIDNVYIVCVCVVCTCVYIKDIHEVLHTIYTHNIHTQYTHTIYTHNIYTQYIHTIYTHNIHTSVELVKPLTHAHINMPMFILYLYIKAYTIQKLIKACKNIS